MVATRCSAVMGGGHHRAAIAAIAVFFMELGACDDGVWVEACSSDADTCVPSSEDMDLCELVSPMLGAIRPFPVIVVV